MSHQLVAPYNLPDGRQLPAGAVVELQVSRPSGWGLCALVAEGEVQWLPLEWLAPLVPAGTDAASLAPPATAATAATAASTTANDGTSSAGANTTAMSAAHELNQTPAQQQQSAHNAASQPAAGQAAQPHADKPKTAPRPAPKPAPRPRSQMDTSSSASQNHPALATARDQVSAAAVAADTDDSDDENEEEAEREGEEVAEQDIHADDQQNSSSADAEAMPETFFARALFDFYAYEDDELTFKADDIIRVVRASDDEWWFGTHDGRRGFLPATYVQRLDNQGRPVTDTGAASAPASATSTSPQSHIAANTSVSSADAPPPALPPKSATPATPAQANGHHEYQVASNVAVAVRNALQAAAEGAGPAPAPPPKRHSEPVLAASASSSLPHAQSLPPASVATTHAVPPAVRSSSVTATPQSDGGRAAPAAPSPKPRRHSQLPPTSLAASRATAQSSPQLLPPEPSATSTMAAAPVASSKSQTGGTAPPVTSLATGAHPGATTTADDSPATPASSAPAPKPKPKPRPRPASEAFTALPSPLHSSAGPLVATAPRPTSLSDTAGPGSDLGSDDLFVPSDSSLVQLTIPPPPSLAAVPPPADQRENAAAADSAVIRPAHAPPPPPPSATAHPGGSAPPTRLPPPPPPVRPALAEPIAQPPPAPTPTARPRPKPAPRESSSTNSSHAATLLAAMAGPDTDGHAEPSRARPHRAAPAPPPLHRTQSEAAGLAQPGSTGAPDTNGAVPSSTGRRKHGRHRRKQAVVRLAGHGPTVLQGSNPDLMSVLDITWASNVAQSAGRRRSDQNVKLYLAKDPTARLIDELVQLQQQLTAWYEADKPATLLQLLHRGALMKISRGKAQCRQFYLFHRLLVYCKRDKGKLTVKGTLALDEFLIRDRDDGSLHFNGETINHAWELSNERKHKWYVLYTDSAASKQRWLKLLREPALPTEGQLLTVAVTRDAEAGFGFDILERAADADGLSQGLEIANIVDERLCSDLRVGDELWAVNAMGVARLGVQEVVLLLYQTAEGGTTHIVVRRR